MKLTTLAFRNIKRNFSKYVMYFFTLTFSVFTVYSFLALLQNEVVNHAFIYRERYRSMLIGFGVVIFVFVTFFLISSNTSFTRARKKEISLYSLFGMTNRKVSKLIFLETMLVGLAALVVGILAGIFFSKLIAMILLNVTLVDFVGDITFSIHPRSIYLTILPFLGVFGLMGLSGLRVISKFELVELFKGEKVSEGKSKGSYILLFLSVLLLGCGYYFAATVDSYLIIMYSLPILISVILGTYLFFWGGLPKILHWLKKNKTKYYRGDNLIAISAFNHRVRSIASTMATIAVLSAVATTAVATGYTLYKNAEKDTYSRVGFDAYFYGSEELLDDVYQAFKNHGVEFESYTSERLVARPELRITLDDWLYYDSDNAGDYFRVYPQSVFNEIITFSRRDLKPVHIKPGEAIYALESWTNVPSLDAELKQAIMDSPFKFSNQTIRVTSFVDAQFLAFGAIQVIILNDDDFVSLHQAGDIITGKTETGPPFSKVTVFKYDNPLRSGEVARSITEILSGNADSFRVAYNTYVELLETFGLVCFIGFFMSIVFILMTASLLYFKQVMAAEEERGQYQMLRKIGMDSELEKRVITKRLLPVFLIPLIIGIIHSIFAMKSADTVVFSFMITQQNSYLVVLGLSSVMYAIYALVYGVFYFITKHQYAKVVG